VSELISLDFFRRPTLEVAADLLGVELLYGECGGIIVETEAYTDDPASHFVTRPKAGRMLGDTWGRVYLYTIYGVHRCLNFTTDALAPGAVLIRALEPTVGVEAMQARRGTDRRRALTSGPAKLYQALGIAADLHGRPVDACFSLSRVRQIGEDRLVRTPRIGISRAADLHWRFVQRDNPFVSR
jgi:DNA-3-methyladenine glycosylase